MSKRVLYLTILNLHHDFNRINFAQISAVSTSASLCFTWKYYINLINLVNLVKCVRSRHTNSQMKCFKNLVKDVLDVQEQRGTFVSAADMAVSNEYSIQYNYKFKLKMFFFVYFLY